MSVLGIDPSTYTGLCLLNSDGSSHTMVIRFADQRGLKRLQLIAQVFGHFLDEHKPELAVIEGYGYGGPSPHTLVTLVEIGTVLRLCLHERRILCYVCPPSVLKKFATGKGNAKKPEVQAEVVKRWGFECPSDDVVDAYVLARLGLELVDLGAQMPMKGLVLL